MHFSRWFFRVFECGIVPCTLSGTDCASFVKIGRWEVGENRTERREYFNMQYSTICVCRRCGVVGSRVAATRTGLPSGRGEI